MGRMCRRSGWLAALVVAAVIGLAACSSGPSTPQVASLGSSSGADSGDSAGGAGNGNSAAPGSAGNPTQLLDEWAACMRSHGDPNQADPVINSDGDIEISMMNVSEVLSQQAHDSSGPCGHYLTAASTALRGGQPAPTGPDQAQLLKYAECMRANGVPKYPDPNGSGKTDLRDIGMDLNSPTFKNADALCSKESGTPGPGAPPPPGVVQVTSCNAPVGRQCPSSGPGSGGGLPLAPSGNGGSGGSG